MCAAVEGGTRGKSEESTAGSAEIPLCRALNPVQQPWKGFHPLRAALGGVKITLFWV